MNKLKLTTTAIALVLVHSILSKMALAVSTMAWIYPAGSFPGELKSSTLLLFRE